MLSEQKRLKMRVLLAAFACLLVVEGVAMAAEPSEKQLPAGKPSEKGLDREAFEQLRKDRDNLLIQARTLLEKNRELVGIKRDFNKFKAEKKALLNEKEDMTQELEVLNEEIEEEKKRFGQAAEEIKGLKQLQQETADDKQRLEKLLAEAKLELGIDKLEGLISSLKSEKRDLDNQIEKIRGDLARLEERLKKERAEFAERLEKSRIESEKEIAEYRNRLEGLQKKYASEVKEKKALGREMSRLPRRLTDVAAERGRIVKGAADRHYNSGVFYAKKGEYKRALAEFKNALKIRSDHAYALYNLGHIYATQLVNRKKAIHYFGEYLRVCPEAKDRDLVRRYILTWKSRAKREKKDPLSVLGTVFGR